MRIKADGNDALTAEIRDKFKDLLRFFLPDSYDIDSGSEPMRLYWGAVYVVTVWLLLELFKERANDACHAGCCEEWSKKADLRDFSSELTVIIADAKRFHQGVYCSEVKPILGPGVWREEGSIAESAVLLSAAVEALGAIFRTLVESVRFVRSGPETHKAAMMGPSSVVSQHAKEASRFLRIARDQLIKKADGKDKNDMTGPVLTPEAIAITLMRRLVSGVIGSGAIDVINLYEEC